MEDLLDEIEMDIESLKDNFMEVKEKLEETSKYIKDKIEVLEHAKDDDCLTEGGEAILEELKYICELLGIED
ncbi:hypothetical protein [Sporosalibacterium faouarense]|uniref:hypothetical protein n=1 Tax=Sporosalibacterium faouarense TaxID=516123 RepID=UPI00192CA478|nr:hypothetical protein [Sporosalibacterium faouarense]